MYLPHFLSSHHLPTFTSLTSLSFTSSPSSDSSSSSTSSDSSSSSPSSDLLSRLSLFLNRHLPPLHPPLPPPISSHDLPPPQTGTYRFLSVARQTATLIGEPKHGLWRIQDNGHVRCYRRNGKIGLDKDVDPNGELTKEQLQVQSFFYIDL